MLSCGAVYFVVQDGSGFDSVDTESVSATIQMKTLNWAVLSCVALLLS